MKYNRIIIITIAMLFIVCSIYLSMAISFGIHNIASVFEATTSSSTIDDDFSTDTSGDYTVDKTINGSTTFGVDIGSQYAYATGSYRGLDFHHDTALTSEDHFVEGDLIYNGNDRVCLHARVSDAAASYDDYYQLCLGSSLNLYRVVDDGSPVYLDDDGGSVAVDTRLNDVRMTVSGTGATVNIKVNIAGGSDVIDYDDTNAARLTSGVRVGGQIKANSSGSQTTYTLKNYEASES